MRRVAVSALLGSMALVGACGSGPDDAVPSGPVAEPLRVLATGVHGVRGPRAAGVAVRTGRRVAVVAARRTTVTAASTHVALRPDLDGDRQPEVVATLGREFAHRLVVTPTRAGRPRVEVARRGWDVMQVVGHIGARWLVVADDPRGRSYLLGFLPRERRWTWSVRLPGQENEVDDVDVQGDRIRISVFVANDGGRSTVLDVTARGDHATVTHTERRPVEVRASSARIDPAWGVDEVREPPRESGEQAGRVEVVRPDGARQVLVAVDNDVPAAALLRADRACALVLVIPPSGSATVTAVAADGRILATQRVPRGGFMNIAAVGRRLLVARREGPGVAVVRALRTDSRIGACG